jgi:lysophospholipase L1-like esterase
VNKPEISGFWINKADMLKFPNMYNLIWFFDSAGNSISLITPGLTTSLQAVPGYKRTDVTNGITTTLEVREELNGWLYIVQTCDKKPSNAATVSMGVYLRNGAGTTTDKVDLIGLTQLEGQTDILSYFIYPESASEKAKTEAEISKNIADLQAAVNPAPVAKVYNTVNFGYNLENTLLKFKSSLAKRNSQIVKIACIGDSITEGYWSGMNWDRAYPVQLRKLMQSKYGGQDEGFVTVYSDDGRWTQTGTGWATSGSKGLGAGQRSSATSGDKLTFTFTGVAVDIVYSKNTDGGTCAVKIDGVDKTALNCNGSAEVYAQTQNYTGLTSGSHTLEIYAPTDGKKVYVEGAYVKTVGDTAGIRVDRRARSGSYTGDWISQLMLDTFSTQPADLFFLALGINDCGASRTPDSMKTNLQTIITKLKTVGNVVLIPMMQANEVADTRFVNWKDYVTKYYELADENNIGLIDVYKLFGSAYQPAQQYGLFGINGGNGEGGDTIHPSARGHQMIADTIFKLIG